MREVTAVLENQIDGWIKELSQLDTKLRPLLARRDRIAEKIRAAKGFIEVLSEPAEDASVRLAKPNVGSEEAFTPTTEYWVPLLEALIELGGKARGEAVVDRIGEKMKGILKPSDYEPLPQSMEIRWRNRVNWQRFNMVKRGLLKKDSPRGIWEITEVGKQWLSTRK